MIGGSTLRIDDFSGGITDNYLSGALNKYRVCDNFVLEKYGSQAKLRLRQGSEVFDVDHALLDSVNATRISTLVYYPDEIIGFVENNVFYQDTAGDWTALIGPDGDNPVFTSSSDGNNVISYASWQGHLFVANDNYEYISKIYKDSSSDYQIRTAGLPVLASTPTVTASNSGSDSYIYRFIYKQSYYVGDVQYIDRGASVEVLLENAAAIDSSNDVVISSIPVLSNTSNDTLWDTTNLIIEIYRTTSGGTNFFYAGEVTNGTTSASDIVTDTDLQTNIALYTEGDVVENDPTPKAKIVHIVDDTSIAYYAGIKEGSETKNFKILQSIPGDPDSVPATFFLDLTENIVGFSSARGRPLALCENGVYRIDGAFDLLGRGGMVPAKIFDRGGCVSSQSVVQTIYGVFWAGADYFYFSDGYSVIPINLEWPNRHREFTGTESQRKKIQGKYDKKNNRIVWTVQEDPSSSDNDKLYILNLNFGGGQDYAFTTASGGDEFRPTAIEFNEGVMYRGDEESYLLWHKDDFVTDPKIDSSISAADWATKTIIYTYESCGFDMGNISVRKVSPRISLSVKNETKLSVDIISINDDGRITESLRPIRNRTTISWGDPDVEWGDDDILWNYVGTIEEQRRFPRKSWRYTYKQIKFSNAKVVITNSDINGLVSTDPAANTLTLVDSTFPSNVHDYYISLENDGYVNEFLISSINSSNDTITVVDVNSQLPDTLNTGNLQWVIRGYPKGEDFRLLSYSVDYAYLGQTQNWYRSSGTGELS